MLDNVGDFRLIRHGETSTYETDSGLTERGRRQAVEKGESLARALSVGTRIWLPHAPTVRATETAAALRECLDRNDFAVGSIYPDGLFDNFRVWCDGQALDPTEAFAAYRRVREHAAADPRPGWYVEVDRYFSLQSGDPVGYWLTTPLQHFEPAASTVRRLWRGIRAVARRAPPGTCVLVSTHSACLRALATAAFGTDPGESRHLEEVRVRLHRSGQRALVAYRELEADVEVPDQTTPPWCTDRWSGHGFEPTRSAGHR